MKIYGKEITDECQYCGDVLQCELFLQGHGIKQERSNITEMFACQMDHNNKRDGSASNMTGKKKKELPEDIKAIYTAVWKIHKGNPYPKSDEDWEQINRECKLLLKMYDCPFAHSLIQTMIAEIERRVKKES